jgi:hypothetical protein
METNLFQFNENLNAPILREAIYSRIARARAITMCLLSLDANQPLEPQALHDVIWAVDSYLEDLMLFYGKLNEMVN